MRYILSKFADNSKLGGVAGYLEGLFVMLSWHYLDDTPYRGIQIDGSTGPSAMARSLTKENARSAPGMEQCWIKTETGG